MNLIRGYDHILGESWSVEDHGAILGIFFGAGAKSRAEARLDQLKHKPVPLQRTVEARAKLLQRLRWMDKAEEAGNARERAERRQRRRPVRHLRR